MNVFGTNLEADDSTQISQRGIGLGVAVHKGRVHVGLETRFSDGWAPQVAAGVSLVALNDVCISLGYSVPGKTSSVGFVIYGLSYAYSHSDDWGTRHTFGASVVF